MTKKNHRQTIDRVIGFCMKQNVERKGWENAPAMSGMLHWGDDAVIDKVRTWLTRAMDMQTSDGCFDYNDQEEYAHGAIPVLTPISNVSSAVGYPLLALYDIDKNQRYINTSRLQIQALMDCPRTSNGGFWGRREGPELWIEPLYLACPFMVRFGQLTGEQKYVDEAFAQYECHAQRLVDPWIGLARQVWCETPNYFVLPRFAGRGNGWMAMGSAELLKMAPDHPKAKMVADYVTRQVTVMREKQDRSGYLRNILDDQNAKLEASSTLMFAYAATRLADMGYLDKSFLGAAIRAFEAVSGSISDDGAVTGVALPPGGPGVKFGWSLLGQGFYLLAAHALRKHLSIR